MVGTSLEPATMPPVPLSHRQSSHADPVASVASRPSVASTSNHTRTMTAMAKPKPTDTTMAMETVSLAPLSSSSSEAAASTSQDMGKSLKKHHSKKKKKRNSVSELTPLILKAKSDKSSEEDVHPLPWFRSPELTRKSSPLSTKDKRRKTSSRFRRGYGTKAQTSICSAIMNKICCGLGTSESDVDLELGTLRSDREEIESEGFKQCVQFLVGLIVVVAIVLIVMIIFEPFQEDASLW